MSAYKNEDTASWDTRKVREGAAKAKGKKQPAEKAYRIRRKRRKLNPVVYVLLVLVISSLAACIGWLLMNDACALDKPWVETEVEITAKDDVRTISRKLKNAGLVNYDWFFELFVRITKSEEEIGVGTFTLHSNMDFFSLVDGMYVRENKPVERKTVMVSIPEGYTVRETIAIMAAKGVNTEEALLEAAKTAVFDYDFINNDSQELTRLEGYLFPDTYEFYVGHEAKSALNKLLSNFNRKMTTERRELVEKSGYTMDQIITIASLIEKETDGTDRAKISSVIHNRLKDTAGKHGTYGVLGIDAALLYVLPDSKGVITAEDLELASPYNLRKYAGLPPSAIANPGLASIDAALDPENTNYYYYALGKDGKHHFFKTLSEHNNFVNSSEYGG